jgi:hypothetical protein
MHLQELTEDHVEAWMRWALGEGRVRGGKAGAGLGVTSVEMSLARLKEALNRAVARRLIAANVAQEVTIPRKARKAERSAKAVVQPWNVEEVHAFVRAVKDDRLYAPFLLSLMGLRPGGDLRHALGRCRPERGDLIRCQHADADGEQDRGGEGHEVPRR